MFVVKPAATSLFVAIALGSILKGHVANAHNRRRSIETIRRRTLRGNDGPSTSPPSPPPAEIVATNSLDDVLIETASFWGRNLKGSGSFGKGTSKGGGGKGGSGGGKGSGKGKGGSGGKGGPTVDDPEIDVDIDRRVGSNDAGQWTRKPEVGNPKNPDDAPTTNIINTTAAAHDI